MPKVSVIVPVYKVEKYLDRCLNSLTAQTLSDIEIILVDDGSPDNSGVMCDRWAERDPRIRVIHKENEGAGLARNAALSIATGDYLGFADSDDYVAPDMYEMLYRKATQYQAQLVMTGFCSVGGILIATDETDVQKTEYFQQDTVFDGKDAIDGIMLNVSGALPSEPLDTKYGFSIWNKLFDRRIVTENTLRFPSERKVLSEDSCFILDYLCHVTRAVGCKGTPYRYCRNGDSVSKRYQPDLFAKSCVFNEEINARLARRMPASQYKIYSDRILQAYARVNCMQEIEYAEANGLTRRELNERLRTITRNEKLQAVLRTYPYGKLPKAQAIFAFTMRYHLIFLLKLLVRIKRK